MSLLNTARQKQSDPTLVEGQLKDKAREIVRAYRHSWDIYSELIQNAVDSINRRYRIYNDPDFYLYDELRQRFPNLHSDPTYTGQIKIRIDISNDEITVCDNGVGIDAEKMEEFLLPDSGDKKMGKEYGFKGYGLTFIAFISKEIHIKSKPFFPLDSPANEFHLNGLFDWLVDDTNSVPFPDSPIPDVKEIDAEAMENWNTIVRVKLYQDYSERFPAVSSAEQALQLVETKDRLVGFEYVLRSRTAIGNTRTLFSMAPTVAIEVKLDVVFEDGTTKGISIPYQYYHPKDHTEIAPIAYEFQDYVDQLGRATFNRNFRGLYHTITSESVGQRKPLNCDFAIAAISSTRLSNIESELGLDQFESNDVGISYGVYLAINGMPTGLRIDDWDRKGGYLKRYFVIVDADLEVSNQLDPGRKGISDYYARLISDKAIELFNTATIADSDSFARFAANNLDHGRGREEGSLPPQDFQNKIAQVRQRKTQQSTEDLEILDKIRDLTSLRFLPTDEQEVVALFFQLQALNIIKGYKTIYVGGSRTVYDAAFEYEIECIEENLVPQDSLGIGQVLAQDLKSRGQSIYVHRNHYAGFTALPELCIDFKQSIGGFLNEVIRRSGTTNKDPNLIDLLIVWDTSVPASIPSNSYTIDSLNDNRRIFHSVTHRLGLVREYNTEIQCIALKTVLEKLI